MTSNIKKISSIRDEITDTYADVYNVPALEGGRKEIEVPRAITSEKQVIQRLREKGAALSDDPASLAAVKVAMAQSAPILTRAGQVGFRDDDSEFVAHHGPVGKTGAILPPFSKKKLSETLATIGTLKEWQVLINVAQHSTAMILALSAAFAAPLLQLSARPSFALVFVSPSRSGKSTVQLVAGSVLGFKTETDLPTLDATEAGLRELAVLFNNHLLILNEVATASGKKATVYDALFRCAYTLLSGRDIERHSSWKDGQGSLTFSTIALISTEFSADVWAERAGIERDPGERVRLITAPVSLGEHSKTFDRPPDELSADELKAWSNKQAGILTKGLRQHSGVAWMAYLEQLIENRETYVRRAEEIISKFEAKMAERADDDIKKDIVSKFGIIAAGGFLAVEAGILPWDTKIIAGAALRSCNAALDALPNPEGELRQDLASLRGMLKGPTILELSASNEPLSERKPALLKSAEGFRRKGATAIEFVVRSECFCAWFKGERARKLLEYLDSEGLLDHDRPYRPGRSIEWAQNQSAWPDGTRPRSFKLVLPRGLKDLYR